MLFPIKSTHNRKVLDNQLLENNLKYLLLLIIRQAETQSCDEKIKSKYTFTLLSN